MITLSSGAENYIDLRGKKYSYFAGNNYLGLATHTGIIEASTEAIKKYGVNCSASRITTGTADIHLELEHQLSLFKGKEDSVIYASGFLGNSIMLSILRDKYSVIFADQLAHPSITGGIPRDIAEVIFYRHCDAGHLEELLKIHNGSSPLIITDGIFALTGEIAPLDRIYSVAQKYGAILVVDDAHATGILGKTGKGTPEHFNLADNGDIFQTETMSKALGGYGGFISGTSQLISSVREKSAIYQASTSLPPPVVAAGIAALKIIGENPQMRIRLIEKASSLRDTIAGMGFHTTPDKTPIIPLVIGSFEKAKNLSLFLEEAGIIVPLMNYPVKQEKFLLRIAVSYNHTDEQLNLLTETLYSWKEKYGTE